MAGRWDDGRRAIIVGGSLGGLLAGLFLQRAGWRVEVHERSPVELAGRGAGIVTHPELFACLEQAGIDGTQARVGVAVSGRRAFHRDGRLAGELELPQTMTSWGRLHALLRRALPADSYRLDSHFVSAEERGRDVLVRFADGSAAACDLLVGADGLFSSVRAQALPAAQPTYAGYVAWRGLAEERALTPRTHAEIFTYFAFCLPPGEQILGYPVAGPNEETSPGQRRYNFVWYRPAAMDGALGELLTDVDGVRHQLSIPPHRIRPAIVRDLRQAAEDLLSPQFAEVIRATGQPFLQAILDFETPRMVLGHRTVLIGDAAFVARPHLGMGVTKAALDAQALAEALTPAGDITAALAAYDAQRRSFGMACVRRARDLGTYMQAQILTEGERQLAERHRSPQAVLTETAVSNWLAVDPR